MSMHLCHLLCLQSLFLLLVFTHIVYVADEFAVCFSQFFLKTKLKYCSTINNTKNINKAAPPQIHNDTEKQIFFSIPKTARKSPYKVTNERICFFRFLCLWVCIIQPLCECACCLNISVCIIRSHIVVVWPSTRPKTPFQGDALKRSDTY